MLNFINHKGKMGLISLYLLAAGYMLISTPFISFAEDAPAIKDINPPPVSSPAEMDLENIESQVFRATGIVDAVDDTRIVIGDIQYTIEPGVSLHCKVGSFVGIKVNDEGNVIDCKHLSPNRGR